MSCDRSAEVHAYYDGEMPRQQRATFEAHLADCADCRQVLAELRKVSELIAAAPLAEMSPMALARLQQSWFAAKDRGVMRIAGWLTAVAASILIAALLLWKRPGDEVPVRVASSWQTAAVMPPAETQHDEASSDLVVVAQWMANDLSPLSADQTR